MLGSNSSAGWGPKLHGGAIEPRLPFSGCAALDIQALNPGGFGGQMFSGFARGLFRLSYIISREHKTSCEFHYSDAVGSIAMTQLPWPTWFRWWSSAS